MPCNAVAVVPALGRAGRSAQALARSRWRCSCSEYRPLARWGGKRMLSEHGSICSRRRRPPCRSLPLFCRPGCARHGNDGRSTTRRQPMFRSVAGCVIRERRLSARGSWRPGACPTALVLDSRPQRCAAAPGALRRACCRKSGATMRASWCAPTCATPTASLWSGRTIRHRRRKPFRPNPRRNRLPYESQGRQIADRRPRHRHLQGHRAGRRIFAGPTRSK